ncbi:Indole-3-acetyl-aspartic acid hydrolase [Burkholderia sp. 8Y]|uniref:amidohydrolase n=1 Tax=Burkholderia sp. 8Y TaxID=2653133 RepID=UPI0012F0718A|nr:amidohydrolase [Burkholderia sp. 8Y]VXC79685.1 Indole-3-acetyl-aspartic acid hydrolase [Burkholderia sp. 8Y]
MKLLPPYPHQERLIPLIDTRRRYHRYPELSWAEFHTTASLCAELEELGFSICWGRPLYAGATRRNLPAPGALASAFARAEAALGEGNRFLPAMEGGYTGVVATIHGGRPGPTRGFRFDIDALPITESGATDHTPAEAGFRSDNPGVMHACGHDGHLTIGLGLARRLAAQRAELSGRVHLFFQPAEEVAGGGAAFAQLPQLAEVESLVALHVGIVNERKIVCDTTWLAARICEAHFKGRSSHAGNAPHEGKNALLAACQSVAALYAIPRHSDGASRINVGKFISDNANNVVSDSARFRFEVRGATDEVCSFMYERALNTINGAAAMNDVSADVRPVAKFVAGKNSESLVLEVARAAKSLRMLSAGEESASRYLVPASEDATYMTRVVQQAGGTATYLLLCSPTRGGHHNERFDFDEDLLGWGVDLCAELTGLPG